MVLKVSLLTSRVRLSDCHRDIADSSSTNARQPICQVAFNGEFGNSRDASVHADGAKSRFSKRVARALWRGNSLRMAIQIWRSLPLLSFLRLRPTFRANRTKRRSSITNFSFRAFPNLPPTFAANRTKRRNSISDFSFTTVISVTVDNQIAIARSDRFTLFRVSSVPRVSCDSRLR
jgi:hypothetical protein